MSIERTFEILSQLIGCSDGVNWIDEQTFQLVIHSPCASLELITELKDREIFGRFPDEGLQRNLDQLENRVVPAGTVILVDVPRMVRSLVIAKDLTSLLLVEGARFRPPAECIILSEERSPFYFLRGGDISHLPADFIRYHKALRMWSLLSRRCDHKDETSDKILFFGNRRIEIAPIFHASDLKTDLAVEEIERFVESSDQEEVKKEIFLSVLSDFLRDHGAETAFRHLLKRTQFFAQRLRESLAVYLAANSPAKLVQEARKEALIFSETLEKIVSGLELKSIAIPAAILLAIKEIEKGRHWSPINCIILVSTVIFFVVMVIMFKSQKSMITPLKARISRSKDEFMERGLEEDNIDLSIGFTSLLERIGGVESASKWVLGLSVLPLIAVIIAICEPPFIKDQTPASPEPNKSGSLQPNIGTKSDKSGSAGSNLPK